MKKLFFSLLTLLLPMLASAQMSLAGREYHKDYNIITDLAKLLVVPDKKGDELTIPEKNWNKSIVAAHKGITAYVTVKFINDKKMKLRAVIRYDDYKAKANGADATARAMMRAQIKNGWRSVKGEYKMNGRTITLQDKKMKKYGEKMIFELSEDGEMLTYVPKFDRIDIPRVK